MNQRVWTSHPITFSFILTLGTIVLILIVAITEILTAWYLYNVLYKNITHEIENNLYNDIIQRIINNPDFQDYKQFYKKKEQKKSFYAEFLNSDFEVITHKEDIVQNVQKVPANSDYSIVLITNFTRIPSEVLTKLCAEAYHPCTLSRNKLKRRSLIHQPQHPYHGQHFPPPYPPPYPPPPGFNPPPPPLPWDTTDETFTHHQGKPGPPGTPGTPGLPGPPGTPGTAGPPGSPGKPGSSGSPGLPGAIGPKGSKGDNGNPGNNGIPGPKGSEGPYGSVGSKGNVGATGDKGEPGIAGLPGLKGDVGLVGLPGEKGENGLAGERGAPGPRGIEGISGPTGPIGLKGSKGDNGNPGSEGVAGPQGPVGPKGTGSKGERGIAGLPGLKGDAGLVGLPGEKGDRGAPGPRGIDGVTSSIALKGSKGDNGNPGNNGIPGSDGPVGPQGPVGPKGTVGAKGEPGIAGLPGLKGDDGLVGLPGEKGESTLSGPVAAKGDKGEPGIAGTPGLKGDEGFVGLPGLKGNKGDKGDMGLGLPGEKGEPGLVGNPIIKGESGSAETTGPLIPPVVPQIPDEQYKIIQYGDATYPGITPRTRACTLSNGNQLENYQSVNKPYGSWMVDSNPITEEESEKFWTTSTVANTLLEFQNLTYFKFNSATKIYNLEKEFEGSANAIYKGAFFYKAKGQPTIVKFSLSAQTTQTLDIPNIQSNNQQTLYTTEHNYFDFSSDDNGLWVIFAVPESSHTGIAKIDVDAMKFEDILNINLEHKKYTEMFIASGVVYTIERETDRTSKISLAIDLYTNEVLQVDLYGFQNLERVTMVTYDYQHEQLMVWNSGKSSAYLIICE